MWWVYLRVNPIKCMPKGNAQNFHVLSPWCQWENLFHRFSMFLVLAFGTRQTQPLHRPLTLSRFDQPMVSAGAPTLLKLLSTKYTVLGDGPSAMSACQFSAAVCTGWIFTKAWLQQTLCGLQSGRVLFIYCQLVLSEEGKKRCYEYLRSYCP